MDNSIPIVAYIICLILIMLISGIVGGLANYFINVKENFSGRELSGYVLLGVVAAFVVPLFLNMISSNLLTDAQTKPVTLLVIMSFCLIAAVFSKSFLENVYNKLLKEVDQVRSQQETIMEANSDQAAPVGETLTKQQVEVTTNLDSNAQNIIGIMQTGKYTFHTPEGIQKATNIALPQVNDAIKQLIEKNIAKQTVGKDNKEFLYLSPLGKSLKIK